MYLKPNLENVIVIFLQLEKNNKKNIIVNRVQ
jgi:hypothetical protein